MDFGLGGAGEDLLEPGDAGERVGSAAHLQRRKNRLSLRRRRKGQTRPTGIDNVFFLI